MGLPTRPLQETDPVTGAQTPGLKDTEQAKKKKSGKGAMNFAKPRNAARTQPAVAQPAVVPDVLNPKPFLGTR